MEIFTFTRLLPRYEDEEIKMQGSFNDTKPDRQMDEEGFASLTPLDPLQLDIEDSDLVDIVDEWVGDYKTFYESKYDLFERRKQNEIHLFGRQILEKEKEHLLKNYESRYQDNVLYEIEGTLKPLAMQRLPDLMVTPGNDSEDSVLMAQEVSKAIDTEIKEKENRFVLGLAFKHLPVYFTAVIKVRWNPEIDDYVFENIHPNLIEVDHTSPTKNADKMDFVSHIIDNESVKEISLKFPEAKEKLYEQLEKDGIMPGQEETWSAMAMKLRYREVWFTYLKRHDDDEVEKIHGVLWKYKDVILHKMRNPNFDYKGEKRYFAYDQAKQGAQKRGLNEQELYQILLTGQLPSHVKEEQVYHNYFKYPRKPFYFMGFDQWGLQPYDETSRIEQNIKNQKSVDKRGKQIEETLDNRTIDILAKGAVTPSEAEEIDPKAPNIVLSVEGKPNDVHARIQAERPSKEEFEEQDRIKNRMYAIAHSNAVRGEISKNAATNTQIGRESDFTAADDLVEDTINDAGQWMADWAMQFMKLRYTADHFKWIMGIAGEAVWLKLNRNMISDGMIVKIKASGTDKLKAQNNAMDMAKMEMIHPYAFYKMMGIPDPEGMTEGLILAKTDPIAYLQKFCKGLDTSEALAQALMRAQLPQPMQQAQPNPIMPGQDLQSLQPPSQPAGAQQPSPTNTGAVAAQPPAGAPQGSPRIM